MQIQIFPSFFSNMDDFVHPVLVLFFPDEFEIYELLDFWLYSSHDLRAKGPLRLLEQFDLSVYVQSVHHHLGIEAGYVFIAPGKHMGIHTDE